MPHLRGFILALASLGFPAFAANTPVTLNFSGSAPNPPLGSTFSPGTAVGQITPFGTAAVIFSQISAGSGSVSLNAVFSIPNGSTFGGTFQGTSTVGSPTTTLNGNITIGTGIFRQASGSVTFSLTITNLDLSVKTLNYNISGSGTIAVQDVGSGLNASPGGLVFAIPENGAPSTQGVTVTNGPGQNLPVQAQASGGSWLSVSPPSGIAVAYSNLSLAVTANPKGLKAGLYNGQVTITYPGGSIAIFVELVVGPAGAYIQLSQYGLSFQGNPGGAPPPPQTIVAINSGVGTLAGLNVTSSTTDSGKWLSIQTTPTPTGSRVAVQAAPGGLQVGKHFGKVTFTLAGAPNSPQIATVVLDVTRDEVRFEVVPDMTTFIPGIANLISPQTLTLYNAGNVPVTWSPRIEYQVGAPGWLSISPNGGTEIQGVPDTVYQQVPFTLSVPTLDTLPAGVYEAVIHVTTTPAVNPIYTDIDVKVYVPSRNANITETGFGNVDGPEPTPFAIVGSRSATATCTPTQVRAQLASPRQGFQATTGLPTLVQAFVLDNCISLVDTGSVTASFSTGEPAVQLLPIGNGMWSGTWTPHKSAADATVTVQAQTFAPALAAGKSVSGTVAAVSVDTPLVSSGGVVSAASGTSPIAPGEFIAIFGTNLATGGVTTAPTTQPFPATLGGTQVLLGGRPLPLYFTANGQIDAIVPTDIPPNTIQQLIVQSGTSLSQPEPIIIGAAQPSVFTQDQSGKGPGAILGQRAGGIAALNTPSNPAGAGDALLIYCTGLGNTSPSIPAGTPAPTASLSYADNAVTVTVGGKPAQVLFAGLAPGYVGLYQVNVIVPSGIAPNNSVPVVVTAAGTDSPPVTVALK